MDNEKNFNEQFHLKTCNLVAGSRQTTN